MGVSLDALGISPKYSSRDWSALSANLPSDWPRAADIVRDRLHGRFLRFIDAWLLDPFSGFVVLSVDSLLAEAVEQFRAGYIKDHGNSRTHVERFLSGPRFQPAFDDDARERYYIDIRCGLLHQAEAKGMWLVRRGQASILQRFGAGGYIIDVRRFHTAVQQSLEDYFAELVDPTQSGLRANLWKKMEHICQVRDARGLLYEPSIPSDGVVSAT